MTDRVPLPRFMHSVIYSCPECWGDLQHEGCDHYWCSSCRKSFHFAQVGLYDDWDPDD